MWNSKAAGGFRYHQNWKCIFSIPTYLQNLFAVFAVWYLQSKLFFACICFYPNLYFLLLLNSTVVNITLIMKSQQIMLLLFLIKYAHVNCHVLNIIFLFPALFSIICLLIRELGVWFCGPICCMFVFFRVVICAVLGLMFYWVFILNFDTPFYGFRKCWRHHGKRKR